MAIASCIAGLKQDSKNPSTYFGATPKNDEKAHHLLKAAEAVVLEHGLTVETEILRSRRIDEAILQIIRQRGFDLVILGTMTSSLKTPRGVSEITEKILNHSPCRVWICGIDYTRTLLD